MRGLDGGEGGVWGGGGGGQKTRGTNIAAGDSVTRLMRGYCGAYPRESAGKNKPREGSTRHNHPQHIIVQSGHCGCLCERGVCACLGFYTPGFNRNVQGEEEGNLQPAAVWLHDTTVCHTNCHTGPQPIENIHQSEG